MDGIGELSSEPRLEYGKFSLRLHRVADAKTLCKTLNEYKMIEEKMHNLCNFFLTLFEDLADFRQNYKWGGCWLAFQVHNFV